IDAERRLDDPRTVARFRFLIEICEVLAARRRMLIEVVAAALGDTLELAQSEWIAILDVGGAARIMRQLLLRMLMEPQVVALGPELQEPVQAMLDPVLKPLRLFLGARLDKILHLHLLELASSKD